MFVESVCFLLPQVDCLLPIFICCSTDSIGDAVIPKDLFEEGFHNSVMSCLYHSKYAATSQLLLKHLLVVRFLMAY